MRSLMHSLLVLSGLLIAFLRVYVPWFACVIASIPNGA